MKSHGERNNGTYVELAGAKHRSHPVAQQSKPMSTIMPLLTHRVLVIWLGYQVGHHPRRCGLSGSEQCVIFGVEIRMTDKAAWEVSKRVLMDTLWQGSQWPSLMA